MRPKEEKLLGKAAVRGSMLQAHLSFLTDGDPVAALRTLVDGETQQLLSRQILPTDWVSLRSLIQVDRAVAKLTGGESEHVFEELGRHSARRNLSGVYRSFIQGEPHKFFGDMALLHTRFQNFGNSLYERTGERTGRIKLGQYTEFSPVFCTSGRGYYEESLRMMNAPGPIKVVETTCQCAGDAACLYTLEW